MTRRLVALVALVAGPWVAVPGQGRPGGPGGGPPMRGGMGEPPGPPGDSARPPMRYGIENDPDPAGAVIERSSLLQLSDAQVQALRTLRRGQQRRVRALADSLDRMNLPGTMLLGGGAGGPPGGGPGGMAPGGGPGGGPGAGRGGGRGMTLAPDQRAIVAPMLDSARAWTRVTRDSALAILSAAQRDSLAAQWQRYRDSLPPGRRPPARP